MKYKLIALDLDGTLKNSKNEITPKTREALIKAQQLGIKVVLASGRPTPGLRHEARELELEKYDGYLLSFNGARVSSIHGDNIYEQTLTLEEATSAYKRSKEYGLACMTYDDDVIITEDIDDQYVNVESFINDIKKRKVDSFLDHLKDPIYKVLLTGEPEYNGKILDEFKAPFGDLLSIYRSAPYFIEVMAKGIDKAASLDRLVKKMGITKEEVIAFGDGYNDLSMIEYAGTGVAMGNAVDGVKERADIITKTNNEDGIAHTLYELIEELN